ncbi:FecCD family ABC transporter permease [Gordonia paraffinivorans]|uniref:FecCD family ABC transporter permease n=1 Tax=Gordonia paraffinivorans TaxID=175628 RepID=UPI001445A764|nr:iron ABC transporter permease [Gordonia paraffinivorans]
MVVHTDTRAVEDITAGIDDENPTATGEPESPTGRRYVKETGIIAVGAVATLVAAVIGIKVGTDGATFAGILDTFWSKITGNIPDNVVERRTQQIVWELRVPRVAVAILGGAALAIAGVLFQGLLRNPLVSPYTLGIAPAAAFGASVAIIVFGASASGSGVVLVAGALIAALLNTVLVLTLASTKQLDATTLILLGIALTQLFSALTAGLQYFTDDEVLAAIVRWTWGSVNGSVWYQVNTLLILVVTAYIYVQYRSGAVNAIAFAGDDAAKSLGVPVTRVRLEIIAVAAVLTAVTIAFTGIIGFVGLVGPHIARLIIGANHRFLIPFSAVIGALLLVIADAVGRIVLAPAVIPVGIIDALIGAPIFIYLILTRRKALA